MNKKLRTSPLIVISVLIIIAYGAFPELFSGLFNGNNNATNSTPVAHSNKVPKNTTWQKKTQAWPYLDESNQQENLSPDLLRNNYYVVFDGSGSMSDISCSGNRRKADVAKTALTDFAQQVPAQANLGMLAFDNSGISERTSLEINNRAQFKQAVNSIYANRGTPLRTAIDMAMKKLTAQARNQLGYGEYHLVIVTDGEADSDQNPRQTVNKIIDNTPVVLHTIGFCIGKNHSLNQPGRILYKSATDAQSLRKSLQDVLAESPSFSAQQF